MSSTSNFNRFDLDNCEVDFEVITSNELPIEFNRVNCWNYRYVKRGLDLTGAIFMGIAFLIPAIAIAVAVLIDSPGEVFYRETRIGRNGKSFILWKFRSMTDAPPKSVTSECGNSLEDDFRWRTLKNVPHPRLTRVGSFIRRWSLDELPQLLNVLRGEMSLVGPRPIVASELPLYQDLSPFYLNCTPGLSGLWQVSGRSDLTFPARAILDAGYVSTWSLSADIKILLQTVPAVITRRGAR